MKRIPWMRILNPSSDQQKSQMARLNSARVQKRPRGPKLVVFLALGIAFAMCGARIEAQQAGKVYRVGRLSGGLSGATGTTFNALRRELRELGYIEGKNIVFELRSAEEKPERLAALADELVRLKVDVISAGGRNDAMTAKKATNSTPLSSPILRQIPWRWAW